MTFLNDVQLVWKSPGELALGLVAQVSRGRGFAEGVVVGDSKESLEKVIRFCVKAGHWSVLEFANLTFRIQCPIFVARQIMRYRHASYIERSLRYCAPETMEWAQMVEDPETAESAFSDVIYHEEYSRKVYDDLVASGAKKEWARAVLPLSTSTVFLMKVNLRELLHIFDERLTPQCQAETRDVVEQMFNYTKQHFPITVDEWAKRRDALTNKSVQ